MMRATDGAGRMIAPVLLNDTRNRRLARRDRGRRPVLAGLGRWCRQLDGIVSAVVHPGEAQGDREDDGCEEGLTAGAVSELPSPARPVVAQPHAFIMHPTAPGRQRRQEAGCGRPGLSPAAAPVAPGTDPSVSSSNATRSTRSTSVGRRAEGVDGDLGGLARGKAIGPGGDGGKRDAPGTDLVRDLQAPAVAGRQLLGLALASAPPHRSDGVDDPASRQPVAAGRLGITGVTSAQRAALLEQVGTGGSMDGAVDTPAPQEARPGGVDDGVDLQRRDVGAHCLDRRRACQPRLPLAQSPSVVEDHTIVITRVASVRDGGAPDGPHTDPAETGGKGAR